MVHRLFLVRTRPDLDRAAAQAHWRESHAPLFGANPGLRGYVQDRPLEEDWERLPFQACSETWFDDLFAERAAFASDYYRERVVADEERFLDRATAWRGRVVGVNGVAAPATGRYRVLVFGARAIPGAGPVAVLHLDRPVPGDGPPRVLSAWTDDRAEARSLAERAGGLAFAAEPALVVAPPEALA